MVKNSYPFPLVFVEWYDHEGGDGEWKTWVEVPTAVSLRSTIGWLVAETKQIIVVVNTVSFVEGRYDVIDDFRIVKSAIKKRYVISAPNQESRAGKK